MYYIEYENAIKSLHTNFPEFDIETLFKIMDCVCNKVEDKKEAQESLNKWLDYKNEGISISDYDPNSILLCANASSSNIYRGSLSVKDGEIKHCNTNTLCKSNY